MVDYQGESSAETVSARLAGLAMGRCPTGKASETGEAWGPTRGGLELDCERGAIEVRPLGAIDEDDSKRAVGST